MLQRGQQIETLVRSGQYERARTELLKLLKDEPKSPEVLNGLAVVDAYSGNLPRSVYYSEMAAKYAPTNPVVWRTHANTLCQLGKYDKAAEAFDHILKIAPGDAGSWLGRSSVERFRGNLDGAAEILKQGLGAAGETEALLSALAGALNNCGQPGAAMELCEKGMKKFPNSLEIASLACNTSQNVVEMSRERVFEVHKRYGEIMQRCFVPPVVRYGNVVDPERKLRIGFVSGDLRRHSVAFFIEPLFANLDRNQFEIFVYSTSHESDAVTQKLRGMVHTWRDVAAFADAQLAERIYTDQIDILVDLHGHTQGHRLGVFHNKPAPVQMTYLGYPNTTGLAGIDYRIVDSKSDPAGLTEGMHTERLVRADNGFLCFTVPEEADTPALQASEDRPVTFGCFNALHKLSTYSIGLWSRILRDTPGSRMLVKCPMGSQSLVTERVVGEFAKGGIEQSRIEIMPAQKTLKEHLAAYLKMDIALDPFPYHGTTTTCEALFMGVPVVSLAGDTHISRVGVSVLSAAGCPQWIAKSEPEYVDIAKKLSKESRSIEARERLRTQLAGSALCDRAAFGKDIGAILRSAWKSWCAGAGAA